jgi:hypothetical protein
MHSAADIASLVRIAFKPFQTKPTISKVESAEEERMKTNELVAFKVLRAMVEDTHRMYKEYGLLQMDAKCGNYLFFAPPSSSSAPVDVEVMSSDYGAMHSLDTVHRHGRTTYPAGAVQLGFEQQENRERFVAISERTCLAQFACVLLELLDVRVGSKTVAEPKNWPRGRPEHIVSFLTCDNSSHRYHEYIGYVLGKQKREAKNMFVSRTTVAQNIWIEFASCWQDNEQGGVAWNNGEEWQTRAHACVVLFLIIPVLADHEYTFDEVNYSRTLYGAVELLNWIIEIAEEP